MKFLIVFAFLPTLLCAQLTETIVSDTNFVRYYKVGAAKGDTTYYLKNNRPIGKWIVYFDTIQKKKALEREYFNRNEDMYAETLWLRNGKVKSTRILNTTKDTCITSNYYAKGKIKDFSSEFWKPANNQWILVRNDSYYENGQIKQTSIDWTSLEKQHVIDYFENGTKQREFNWVNGTLVEEFKEYFENGKIKSTGTYLNPKDLDPTLVPSARPSIETGIWKYYNDAGKLIKEEFYKNGTLISTTEK